MREIHPKKKGRKIAFSRILKKKHQWILSKAFRKSKRMTAIADISLSHNDPPKEWEECSKMHLPCMYPNWLMQIFIGRMAYNNVKLICFLFLKEVPGCQSWWRQEKNWSCTIHRLGLKNLLVIMSHTTLINKTGIPSACSSLKMYKANVSSKGSRRFIKVPGFLFCSYVKGGKSLLHTRVPYFLLVEGLKYCLATSVILERSSNTTQSYLESINLVVTKPFVEMPRKEGFTFSPLNFHFMHVEGYWTTMRVMYD